MKKHTALKQNIKNDTCNEFEFYLIDRLMDISGSVPMQVFRLSETWNPAGHRH